MRNKIQCHWAIIIKIKARQSQIYWGIWERKEIKTFVSQQSTICIEQSEQGWGGVDQVDKWK